MTFKQLIGKLHLWLGLASGLIVFIISITGCILAFETEIKELTEPYQFTKTAACKVLPPSQLKTIAAKLIPGNKVNSIEYKGAPYSAAAYSYGEDFYWKVYLNPYTGEVLKVSDMDKDFFHIILHGHFYLWLPESIGQPIVASATLIFVILLVSGLILWWPKNSSAAKQRFSFKWKETTKWKRKNYDLHNILGFYAMAFALILALTGLVWGFKWFSKSVYWATSGGKTLPAYSRPFSDTTKTPLPSNQAQIVDLLWSNAAKANPARSLSIDIPNDHKDPIGINVNPARGTYYKADNSYFDQYTGKPLPDGEGPYNIKYENSGIGNKLRRMNYDIHVGAILGLPGKILAFCISLICASLPLTGFYIWWGRNKKQKKDKPKSKNKATLQTA